MLTSQLFATQCFGSTFHIQIFQAFTQSDEYLPPKIRFGFQNASSIDTLLDRDDVALEHVLDEDDLLQECKAQNTRLIDYFQRVDVLQRLLGYVSGEVEGEERGRFK